MHSHECTQVTVKLCHQLCLGHVDVTCGKFDNWLYVLVIGCEWAKYSSHNAALFNVIVCVERHSHSVASCRRLAVYRGRSGVVQAPSL